MLIVYLVSFVVHFLDASLNVNYSCNAMFAWLFYSFTFVYINVLTVCASMTSYHECMNFPLVCILCLPAG